MFYLTMLLVNKSFPWVLANLNIIVFGVMACLDFVLFNRFILPSPIVTSSVAPSAPSLMSIEDIEMVELPSTELVVASAIDLKRKSQPTRKKKFYNKFLEQCQCNQHIQKNQYTDLPDTSSRWYFAPQAQHMLQGQPALPHIRFALPMSPRPKMVGNFERVPPLTANQNLQQDFVADGA